MSFESLPLILEAHFLLFRSGPLLCCCRASWLSEVRLVSMAASKTPSFLKNARYLETIAQLPTNQVTAEKAASMPADQKECIICLDPFEAGDTIKFLPCFHRFHQQCTDHWLSTNSSCPVCKHSILSPELEKDLIRSSQQCIICSHCNIRLLYNPSLGNVIRCHQCSGLTQALPASAPAATPAHSVTHAIVVCPTCRVSLSYNPSIGSIVRCNTCQQVINAAQQ